MNVAAGNPVERGKYLEQINPKQYVNKLIIEQFNGYLCVSIHGLKGLEEGTIFFHNGNIVSSNYEYFKFNKAYLAEEAIKRSLNALLAKTGVIDLYSLSSYQVQLILTLNEENNLKNKITKKEFNFPLSFNEDYEKQLITELGEDISKEDLLKRFGLTKTVARDSTRIQLISKANAENEQIEKTVQKAIEKKESKKVSRFDSLSKMLK